MLNWIVGIFIFVFVIKIFFFDSGWYDIVKRRKKKTEDRKKALIKAKNFLKPYKDIFGDFCLSNKNCSVSYISKKMIFAIEKIPDEEGRKRSFVASDFQVVMLDDFWTTLCNEFSYDTTYNQIYSQCVCHTYSLKETYINKNGQNAEIKPRDQRIALKLNNEIESASKNIIDVNSCSEAELMALPGVNAIVAKKIIKYREDKGDFISAQQFIDSMNIKPHFANQIKDIISTNPNKNNKKQKGSSKKERIIDI